MALSITTFHFEMPLTAISVILVAGIQQTKGRIMSSGFAPAKECQVTTNTAVQAFWLQTLSQAKAFTRWVLDEISPWLGQQILEVGCGIGTYTTELAVGSRKITAIDMERAFVEEAARRLAQHPNVRLICGDATAADTPKSHDEAFDTVILLDVLEHIEDDVTLLARLGARLGLGGHLILKVPAMPSLYSPMDEAIGHRRRYDKTSLTQVISGCGLEVVRIWSFNAAAVPAWWWNGRVLKRRSPPQEQVALYNRLVPALRPLDRLARLFCGVSLFAVARQPAGQV
jgi:2-polyprenyl-3-methyl-5-hydroxy-6-metoxy-1,4-benzoquinol methylase